MTDGGENEGSGQVRATDNTSGQVGEWPPPTGTAIGSDSAAPEVTSLAA